MKLKLRPLKEPHLERTPHLNNPQPNALLTIGDYRLG